MNSLRMLNRYSMVPIANQYRVYSSNQNTSGSGSELPINKLESLQTSHLQAENGIIFDKKPFKITLQADKKYSWCLCGKSKTQPLCDGTHKDIFLKIKLRPIRFSVEKTGDYWLCNCKQTKKRPFCDGTHKQSHIQEAIR